MKSLKVILIAAAAVVVAGLSAMMIVLAVKEKKNSQGETYNKKEKTTVTFDGESYIENDTTNILLIGLDAYGKFQASGTYYNEEQCDFIVILNIDNTNKTYKLFEINRDTMCNVIQLGINQTALKDRAYEQIALAHNQGDGLEKSSLNVVNTVSEFLYGITIDNYITLKMDAIGLINDSIGGVTITLSEDQDYSSIDESWVPGATIELKGDDALKFIRARKGVDDQTNIARMKRETQYMEAFMAKIDAMDDTTSVVSNAFLNASDYILADSSILSSCDSLFNTVKDYTYLGSVTPAGTATVNENNNIEFTVDEASLKSLVKETFFTKYAK